MWSGVDDPVEAPTVGNALELVLARVFKGEARAGDKIPDRARHKHLRRLGQCSDARTHVHRDPANLPVDGLDFPGVNSGSNLQIKGSHCLGDGLGAPHRAGRAVEHCEETVTGGIHFSASVTTEHRADHCMVSFDDVLPRVIS